MPLVSSPGRSHQLRDARRSLPTRANDNAARPTARTRRRPPDCENGGVRIFSRIAIAVGIALRRRLRPRRRHGGPRRRRRGRRRLHRHRGPGRGGQPPLRPPFAREEGGGSGPGRPRRPRTGRPTGPPRPAGPCAEAERRGERYCPLDPAHRTDSPPPPRRPPPRTPRTPTREPLPRQGRRPAHVPPGRGRQNHRVPHRTARQGPGRRQGHPQDDVEVRRAPRAADPGRPPAVAGEGRPRHRQPGGGRPRLPPDHGRTSSACRGASPSSR